MNIPTGNGALAAIDTGTTLVAGPSDAVANIYLQIPGSKNQTGQLQGFFSFRESLFTLFTLPSTLCLRRRYFLVSLSIMTDFDFEMLHGTQHAPQQ